MAASDRRYGVLRDEDVPVPSHAHCANGLHVARLGSPCVCGDLGPALKPVTKIVLGPEPKLSYTAPH